MTIHSGLTEVPPSESEEDKLYREAGEEIDRVAAEQEAKQEAEGTGEFQCAEPNCGRLFPTAQALGSHRHNVHGVRGEHRRPKKRPTKKTTNGKTVGRPRQTRVEPLTADDVFFTVVAMLFPGGAVPVQAMEPLMAWRDATQAMLDTLVSS